MPAKGPDAYCYNCHHPVAQEDVYCSNCGQKHQKGRHSMMKLFSDFFEINFNLNNRLFRSLRGLASPGYLTKEFFKGKHKKFNSPIQLFFVFAVIFFSLLSWSNEVDINSDPMGLHARLEQKKIKQHQDSLLLSIAALTTDEKLKVHIDTSLSNLGQEVDTLTAPVTTVLDSLDKSDEIIGNIGDFNISLNEDTLQLGGVNIPAEELLNKTHEEIIQKYFPNAVWYKKVFLRQGLKFGMDQSLLARFLLTRFPILLLIVTPLFALLLKLLYVRRPFYFIEHFVFTIHLNTATILLCLLSLLLSDYLNAHPSVTSAIIFIWIAYFLFALKRFYGQSWPKTLLKFILANILGVVVGLFSLFIILGIAFLFF